MSISLKQLLLFVATAALSTAVACGGGKPVIPTGTTGGTAATTGASGTTGSATTGGGTTTGGATSGRVTGGTLVALADRTSGPLVHLAFE